MSGAVVISAILSLLVIVVLGAGIFILYRNEKTIQSDLSNLQSLIFPQYTGCFQDGGLGGGDSTKRTLTNVLSGGAFVPSTPANTSIADKSTLSDCLKAAKTAGYTYAGIEDSTACFAGDVGYNLYGNATTAQCTLSGAGIIGGNWSLGVYQLY